MEKLLLTVNQAAEALSLSRSRVYALINSGDLQSVKIGGNRRIASESIEQFVREATADAS